MKKHLSQNKKNYILILVLDVIENLCFSSLVISGVGEGDWGWALIFLFLCALRILLYALHGVLSYCFTKSVLFPSLIFLFATVLSFAEILLFNAVGMLSNDETLGLLPSMIFMVIIAFGLHLIFSLITKLVLFLYGKLIKRKKSAQIENTKSSFGSFIKSILYSLLGLGTSTLFYLAAFIYTGLWGVPDLFGYLFVMGVIAILLGLIVL